MFDANNFNPNAGNSIPKVINPGTHVARIVNVELDQPPYDKSAYFVNIFLEGKPQPEGFEGILIDKTNPARGRYKGQIGTVKSGRFPFSTFEFQGRTVERNDQIFRFVMNLATQLGVLEAIKKDQIKAASIEEYVDKVKPYFIGKWGMFTVGGQEYYTEGYSRPNYRLFFPKVEQGNFPFSALKDEKGNVIKLIPFNEEQHIVVAKKDTPAEASVDSFSPGSDLGAPAPSNGDLFAPAAPAAPAVETAIPTGVTESPFGQAEFSDDLPF